MLGFFYEKNSEKASNQTLAPKISSPKKSILNTSIPAPTNPGKKTEYCVDKIRKDLSLKKYSTDFFVKHLSGNDQDLAEFIKEGWDNPKLDPDTARSKAGRLFLGISYGGIRTNINFKKNIDLNKAKTLLKTVIRDDPDNAFPLVHYAIVMKKAGHDQEAKKALQEAASKNYFESYLYSYPLKLIKATGTDPLLYEKSYDLSDNMPHPLLEMNELMDYEKVDLIKVFKLMLAKPIKYGYRGRDLIWDNNDAVIAEVLIEDLDPEFYQSLPQDRHPETFNIWEHFPSLADDNKCNVENIKDILELRQEWFKSL